MLIDNNLADIEVVSSDTEFTVTGHLEAVPTVDTEFSVEALKKEYSIVGDGLYAKVDGDTTPEWLLSTIDIAINLQLKDALYNLDATSQELINAISEIELARNAYEEYINIDATVDRIIATRVQQLDARIDTANSKITEIDQAYVSEDRAFAIAGEQISSSLNTPGGELFSQISNINLTLTAIDEELLENYEFLHEYTDERAFALSMQISEVTSSSERGLAELREYTITRVGPDGSLTTQVTDLQADFDDVSSTLKQDFVAFANEDGSAGATYEMQLKTEGVIGPDGLPSTVIGGMVLDNNGTKMSAGFDVDAFWIGRTDGQGNYPFQIVGNDIKLVGQVSVEGQLYSHDFPNPEGDIVGNPAGFRLSSTAAGTNADPHIYGGYIRGSSLEGGTLTGSLLQNATGTFKIDLNAGTIYIA